MRKPGTGKIRYACCGPCGSRRSWASRSTRQRARRSASWLRSSSACLRQLREVGLHKGVLPLLDVILDQPLGERFVTLALAQTDERVLAERPVSPAFLFAALLWHEVLAAWKT